MGNTINEVTTILLEASQYLKDNRLPPHGFMSNQPYDSLIAITGKARIDGNFNKDKSGVEGNGSDLITYRFPYTGNSLRYGYKVCYQSIKPSYSQHLSGSASEESKRFTQMFSDEDLPKTEIISKQEYMYSFSNLDHTKRSLWNIYPNPARDKIHIEGISQWPVSYSIYTLNGRLVKKGSSNTSSIPLDNLTGGNYTLKIISGNKKETFKIMVN